MNAIRHLTGWLARLFPAPPREVDEARRRAIRSTTLEQLGISHWSSHTHL